MEDSIRKKPDWRSICDTSASLNPRAGDQYAPQRKTLHMMNILKPYLTAAIYIFSPRAVGASLQNDGVVCLTQLVRAGALVSVRPASRVVVRPLWIQTEEDPAAPATVALFTTDGSEHTAHIATATR
ncbi:hypothetical protein F2P81_013359 [Scophthalmus maximus]|uniref:Uncharacterized protein n=1 Tax=Scophthalmus maximus TaxID=52904 RepID=A0A6A4SX60_SCOMX|nr:hypothetical protein F2P81_013359 [Scophthalmus maximus]